MSKPKTTERDVVSVSTVNTPSTTQVVNPPEPEELLAQRTLKRLEKNTQNHAKAEEKLSLGASLFDREDYWGSIEAFLEAARLWNSNASAYCNLAAAFMKVELYEQADEASMEALFLDPKLLEARFLRGLARLHKMLLHAAKIDFESVLEHEPTHSGARELLDSLKDIEASENCSFSMTEAEIEIVGFPCYDDAAKVESGSVSDSSDCNHVGNGIPCRFYNNAGCSRGESCKFSHAPDEKSIRDNLGKNVCIYHIMGSCKFGDDKCIYSHTTTYLPDKGWWTSPEEIAMVKTARELSQKSAREQRELKNLSYKVDRKGKKSKAKPRQAGRSESGGGQRSKQQKGIGGSVINIKARAMENAWSNDSDRGTEDELEERMQNSGFTNDELQELLCQGVKPWDDDAWDVLHALSSY